MEVCHGVIEKDAVLAVTDLVNYLDRIWDECENKGKDFAFTVGKFFTDTEWHAMTKISGAVEFSLDMRSLDGDFIESMTKRVCEEALKIEKKRGVQFNLGDFTRAAPGPMDEHIKTRMLSGADNLGIPYMEIASGASTMQQRLLLLVFQPRCFSFEMRMVVTTLMRRWRYRILWR